MSLNSNNPEASKRSLQDFLYLGVKKWLFIKLVWMESRAPLRKTALCEGLRDRIIKEKSKAMRPLTLKIIYPEKMVKNDTNITYQH